MDYHIRLPSCIASPADLLRSSYHNLGANSEWRRISEQIRKPTQAPFSDRVWGTLSLESGFSSVLLKPIAKGGFGFLERNHYEFLEHILEHNHIVRIGLWSATRGLPAYPGSCIDGLERCFSRLQHSRYSTIKCFKPCMIGFGFLIITLSRSWNASIQTNREIEARIKVGINDALEVLIQEIELIVAGQKEHSDLGRKSYSIRRVVEVDLFHHHTRLLEDMIEFITRRRTDSIEDLHLWRPDIFPASLPPHTQSCTLSS